jgi:integrase
VSDRGDGWSLFRRVEKGRPGRYVLKYRVGTAWPQKTLPRTIDNDRAANDWRRTFLGDLAMRGELQPKSKAEGITVAELADKWIELRRGRALKASTLKDAKSLMTTHVVKHLGAEPVAGLTVKTVREFVRKVRDGGAAAYTVRNALAVLTLFLDDVIGEEWAKLPGNPARLPAVRVELPEQKPRHGRRKIVPELEWCQKLLDCQEIPAAWRVRYALAMTTALRDGEIAGLTFADLELEGDLPRATVDKAVAMYGATGYATSATTKTETSDRIVPLHPAAVTALAWWKEEGWTLEHAMPVTGASHVFRGTRREQSRPKSAKRLREHLKLAGCPTSIDGHNIQFRHLRTAAASWLNAQGVEEGTIGALLGHAGKTVTRGSYVEEDLRRLATAVRLLPLRAGSFAAQGGTGRQGVVQSMVPDAPAGTERGAPGRNRTCDQRFRKRIPAAAPSGTEEHTTEKSPLSAVDGSGATACSGFAPGASVVQGHHGGPTDNPALEAAQGGMGALLWEAGLYDVLANEEVES